MIGDEEVNIAPDEEREPSLEEVVTHSTGGVYISLEVGIQHPDGRREKKYCKDGDMTLANFTQLMWALLASVWAATNTSLTSTANVTASFTNPLLIQTATFGANLIAFGTATTPAAFSDYTLGASVGSGTAFTIVNATTLQIVGTYQNSSGITQQISEIGYWITGVNDTSTLYQITHDNFSPVAIPNGKACYAIITFTFS
jgi:hypothetical protein